jgi:uncharacterized protein YciI
MVDQNGPTYFVVFHSPGPNWVSDTPYNEQPGFYDHVKYIDDWFEKGSIILSGPFMEPSGGMAAGGMAIFKSTDLKTATELGTEDPTVKSGLLNVVVKPWWVPFHH